VRILEANTGLEQLHLMTNCLPSTAGYKLSLAIVSLKNLKELSIDQNIISRQMVLKLATAFSIATDKKLVIYNDDHQTTEAMSIRGTLGSINTLIMCKYTEDRQKSSIQTDIPEAGKILLLWVQSNIINTSGVLRFLSSLRNITTLKVFNDSELTELEVDTIATVISENVQLENVLFGNESMKLDVYIADDIGTTKDTTVHKIQQLFPDKLLFKVLSTLQNNTNLKTLDLSGKVITEELSEQLAIVLAKCTKLETLLLGDCSLGNEGVNVIANSLKNITTLRKLSLSWDDITEVAANHIVTVMECNSELEEVCLDGSLQPPKQLSQAIKNLNLVTLQIDYKLITSNMNYDLVNCIIDNSKLKNLILKNYSLQVTGVLVFKTSTRNIKELIVYKLSSKDIYMLKQDPSSVMVVVDDNKISVEWCQDDTLASTGILRVVSAFKDIASVRLINNTLSDYTDKDVDVIATTMASFTEIVELTIIGYSIAFQDHIFDSLNKLNSLDYIMYTGPLLCTRIHTSTVTNLSTLLINNSDIQHLQLTSGLLKPSQVTEITTSLKTHTTLKTMVLHNNNIINVHDVADTVGQILLKNKSMQKFYIGVNRLQAKGIVKILGALKQLHKLKELTLGSNNITDDISDNMIHAKLHKLLVEVITHNPELETLGIQYVSIHSDGAAKVINALKSLSYLKGLDISGNNITKEAAGDIATVIAKSHELFKLFAADNYLGTAGISTITKALVIQRRLEVLDISSNNITSEAAESVSKMIKSNPQLKSLLLGENHLLKMRSTVDSNHMKLKESNSFNNIFVIKLTDVFIKKLMLEIK